MSAAPDRLEDPAPTGMRRAAVRRFDPAGAAEAQDWLAEETPVALEYNGVAWATMLATPCNLEDFAVGFSVTEGLVDSPAEIGDIWVDPREGGIVLHIDVPEAREALLQGRRRALAGRSGCGLCGLESLAQVLRPVPPVPRRLRSLPIATVARAAAQLAAGQSIHRATGAVHAAGWSAPDGTLVLIREDVGRHNALDKTCGALLRSGGAMPAGFLVMSSRASYEIVLKSAALGIELVAAVSAPTGLAVRLAEQAGITLAGFVRGDRCVVYSHPERISG